MALQMAYGAMADDAVKEDGSIQSPQALVARRKDDGSVVLTVNYGDDNELNRGLAGLKVAFGLMSSADFMAAQQGLFAAQGIDMTALIDAEMGVESEEEPESELPEDD